MKIINGGLKSVYCVTGLVLGRKSIGGSTGVGNPVLSFGRFESGRSASLTYKNSCVLHVIWSRLIIFVYASNVLVSLLIS